jgi:hypothetical protein
MVDSRLIEFRGDNIHIASPHRRRVLCENGSSFLPLRGRRFGAAFGHAFHLDARDQRRAFHHPGDALCDFVLSRLHSDVEKGIDWTIGMISAFYENSGSTTSLSANCPDVAIRTAREIAGNGK